MGGERERERERDIERGRYIGREKGKTEADTETTFPSYRLGRGEDPPIRGKGCGREGSRTLNTEA